MSDLELVVSAAEPSYLTSVYAEVDATIRRLAAKQFQIDPVVEARYSGITSIVSSAYKRSWRLYRAGIRRRFAAVTAFNRLGRPCLSRVGCRRATG